MALSRSVLFLISVIVLAACEPTVRNEATKEPITINLNVKIDAEIRIKLEEQAAEDIKNAPDLF